ncbi:MAG: sigma-54 dependent transcriptional regulator [Planctomycetota bacterium]
MPELLEPNTVQEASQTRARITVADDEESMRFYLARTLRRHGFEVETADDGRQVIDRLGAAPPDLFLIDLKMPGADGIEVTTQVRAQHPGAPVILMTAYGTISSAVEAMRRGAFDYITKPFAMDDLLALLERALQSRPAAPAPVRAALDQLIGESPAMREVAETLDLVSRSTATVMVVGESGTGKEIVARTIHHRTHDTRHGAFVAVNCATLPDGLLENELFGHEPGAFTGATERKRGLIERADRGTLFLDRVTEHEPLRPGEAAALPAEREVMLLGSAEAKKVSVRVIAASGADLDQAVETGRLREDLVWRLNVVPIRLPPLCARPEDIPLLASHFLKVMAAAARARVQGFTIDAMHALVQHAWPGNVRELQNVVERLIVLCGAKESIGVDDLPAAIRGVRASAAPGAAGPAAYVEALAQFERHYLRDLLRQTRGNVSKAAHIAGISRPNLHRKLNALDLEADEFRG